MPTPPLILSTNATPLYQLAINQLALDTDPAVGLLVGLGQRNPDPPAAPNQPLGAYSLYPNFSTSGPSPDRTICPTPFVIAYDGGLRALDRKVREARIFFEIHDDEDMGNQRIPGIIARINFWLLEREWRPTSDSETIYGAGLSFESRSPALPDKRYNTQVVQLAHICSRVLDRTSSRGYNG
jgi:hypothetical protein